MSVKWPALQNKMAEVRSKIAAGLPYKPTAKDIFGDLPVLTGGTRTFEVAQLSPLELARLTEFLDYYGRKLQKVSPVLAEDFIAQQGFFLDVAAYAKARFENKPYNEDEVAELPRAGQLGAQALHCQDLRSIGEVAGNISLHNTWDLPVVAGTVQFIFGGCVAPANLWFTTNWNQIALPTAATIDERCIIAIMKNGIIESGTTPTIGQIRYNTQGQAYPPWRPDILRDAQVECDKPVYQYHTPGAMILTPDLGTSLGVMPTRDGTISPRVVGLVFGEFTYLNQWPKWNV